MFKSMQFRWEHGVAFRNCCFSVGCLQSRAELKSSPGVCLCVRLVAISLERFDGGARCAGGSGALEDTEMEPLWAVFGFVSLSEFGH